jgi:hypothetical protein
VITTKKFITWNSERDFRNVVISQIFQKMNRPLQISFSNQSSEINENVKEGTFVLFQYLLLQVYIEYNKEGLVIPLTGISTVSQLEKLVIQEFGLPLYHKLKFKYPIVYYANCIGDTIALL